MSTIGWQWLGGLQKVMEHYGSSVWCLQWLGGLQKVMEYYGAGVYNELAVVGGFEEGDGALWG